MEQSTDKAVALFAVGLSLDYMLRVLDRYVGVFGGNLMTAVIAIAIHRANTQHLQRAPDLNEMLANGVSPDQRRRPVSVKSIADSLGLPYETVRRHVGGLIARRKCCKITGGVIIPAEVMGDWPMQSAMGQNYADLNRMAVEMRRAGFDL